MAVLTWGAAGRREYQLGLFHGVIYPPTGPAFPWSGLRSVSETLVVGGTQAFYQDGIKSHQTGALPDFKGEMKGLNNPRQLAELTGRPSTGNGLLIDNQPPVAFGLSYETILGNDLQGDNYGSVLHYIPSLIAVRKGFTNETVSDDLDPEEYSWDLISQLKPGFSRPAYIIQSNRYSPAYFAWIKGLLQGTATVDAVGLVPEDIEQLYAFGRVAT